MRAFAAFFGILALALLAGAALAYPAFLAAAHLGSWAFHRVAGRLAMLLLAAEFAWLCRRWGLHRARDYGYGLPWRRFLRQSLLWGAVGIATAAAGAAFLCGTGLRALASGHAASAAAYVRLLALAAGSGVAVALIEETVMRGALHTAIEHESGQWAAALLTAPLFAVMHFFAKVRIAPEQVGPGSGFDLLLRSFAPLAHPAAVLDSFLAWLAVGLLLSLTRVLTGNIAVAVGLHAGWVMVLRLLMESTDRTPAPSVWVGRFDGLLGFWILPWAAAIALALWGSRRAWTPYARAPSASSR